MSMEHFSTNVDAMGAQIHSALATNAVTIEPIDYTVLRALAEAQEEGEPDLIVELIDLYLDDAPQLVDAIQQAATAGDEAALKRAAHTLKGSSGSMGVSQVAEICKIFEQLRGADLAGRGEVLLQLLVREFYRVREALLTERLRRLR